mmetsp:Transcript_50186/g.106863  ORF Transcript_50186/g.106863 Transcript_50186/m.106863 type:complete len:374 (+) Transcript_50186:991-2112(+)
MPSLLSSNRRMMNFTCSNVNPFPSPSFSPAKVKICCSSSAVISPFPSLSNRSNASCIRCSSFTLTSYAIASPFSPPNHCSFMTSASFTSSLSPTYSATSPNKGVSAMEMMTLAVRRLPSESGMIPLSEARLNTTNANSPPPARRSPTRAASAREMPSAPPAENITLNLMTRNERMPTTRVGQESMTVPGSRAEPAVTKKTPRRIPSNGLMSASICARYPDSARRTPAANAPVVEERPKKSDTTPIPTATNKLAATNDWLDLLLATTWNTFLNATLARLSTAPNPTVALNASMPSAIGSAPPSPVPTPSTSAMSGSITNRGATARSCSNRIDSAAIPSGRSSHPFSLRMGSTNALEDNAPAAAMANATTGCSSN